MGSMPSTIPTLSTRCTPGVQMKVCTEPNNILTQCLHAEGELWSQIAFNPTFPLLRIPSRYRILPSHPFDVMPSDAIRLNALPSTSTPTPIPPVTISAMAIGNYTPLVSYLVPAGFDGVINTTVNKFVIQNGPGLQDGSGMLTWVMQINNYLAIDYNNITIQMGDTPTLGPVAHDGGIRIRANDLITFYALLNAAGAAFLDPNGIVLAAFQGWIYPNR